MHKRHHHNVQFFYGPPRGLGGPPGPPPHRGPGRGFGPRARRGDVRAAALLLLAEEPRNGYQLMQELEDRTNGLWRPSPGAIYPALAQLEDEGLIAETTTDGKKVYALTDEGRRHLDEHTPPAPWEEVTRGAPTGAREIHHALRQLHHAAEQIVHSHDEALVTKAEEILTEARKALYRLLAD